jgi:hypothetical protein
MGGPDRQTVVIAKRSTLIHEGRALRAGATLEVSLEDALALRAAGTAYAPGEEDLREDMKRRAREKQRAEAETEEPSRSRLRLSVEPLDLGPIASPPGLAGASSVQ